MRFLLTIDSYSLAAHSSISKVSKRRERKKRKNNLFNKIYQTLEEKLWVTFFFPLGYELDVEANADHAGDRAAPREVIRLVGHSGKVEALAISADSKVSEGRRPRSKKS